MWRGTNINGSCDYEVTGQTNHKINSKRPEKFNPLFILTTKALYLNVVFQTKRKDTVIFINKRWHFMKGALIRLYIKDPTGVRTTAPGLLGLE